MCRMESAYQRHLSQEGTKRSAIADLPSGISVAPHRIGKSRFWRVRLGTRFTGGKRVEMHFPTLDKARKWIFGDAYNQKAAAGSLLELKARAGTAVFELSSAQVNEAINAFKRLGKVNMSLTEAVDFAIKNSRPDAGIISVEEAIEKALETKRSKRPSYIRDLRKRWSRFKEWLPAAKRKAINTIGQVDIRRYLTARKLNPQGERNELRNLSVLFSWTVQHHHMTANPCSGIKVEDSPSEEPVRVLSIAEIKHLLELAQMELQATLKVGKTKISVIKVYPGDLIPWFVLGLFAGLRPEETVRLDWADIDFGRRQIDLPARKAKGRTRRIIPMEPNLIEWLKPYRPGGGKGKVVSNFRWHFQVFQRSAGPEWNPWPKDCLRHSYGPFHLAKFRHAGSTAENMGHRSTNMLYNHYRDVIKDQADVDAFWN
jgi:integrase